MSEPRIICSRNLFIGNSNECINGAFLVENGRITAQGSREEMHAASPEAHVTDFGSSFVCPGFHDSHLHFFHSALYSSPLAMRYCGTSEADCVEALKPLAARRPEGSWLLCQGWREAHWNPAI